MSANADGTKSIRVPAALYDALTAEQRRIRDKHGWTVSFGDIIAGALADREAWRAMGEAAREADRKPVPS